MDRLPCQRREVHFLCTLLIRRTGSIPSCVCFCAGHPRGLDQSVETSPDPQSWDWDPSSSSPAGETGAPEEPGLCICLSNTTRSFGLFPKSTEARRGAKIKKKKKKDRKAEMSKPSGFYPHSPDPVFHQKARAGRPSKEHKGWKRVKLCILLYCSSFLPDWRLKVR